MHLMKQYFEKCMFELCGTEIKSKVLSLQTFTVYHIYKLNNNFTFKFSTWQ